MTKIGTMQSAFLLPALAALLGAANLAYAAEAPADVQYILTLKDHQFSPANLDVPAGKRVKLIVKNADAGEAEFESDDLDREKIVSPHGEITVLLGTLEPGTYTFLDDFHRMATGTITVK